MSDGTKTAAATFGKLLKDAENLISIHRSRNVMPGARVQEPSLNRAAIVMTVAAWQTYVELTAGAILATLKPPVEANLGAAFDLMTAELAKASEKVNTPDVGNTLALFSRFGFDPSPNWAFTIKWPLQVGKVSGPKSFTGPTAKTELNAWLQVRHVIAHGKNMAGNPQAASVTSGRTNKGPSVHRSDAERCLAFFRALVKATSEAADAQFR